MESRKMAMTLLLSSVLLTSASLLPPSSSSGVVLPSLTDSSKVSLGLYYESLCPYSANFIVNHLVKLFQNDVISIVDLHLSPWGNAKIRGNETFECQHGPMECFLDTVEACAIDVWPKLNDHFPFIYCVESLVFGRKYTQWTTCYDKLGLDPKPVDNCYNSGRGKELELHYAAETNALEPPHKYVPWVVVDGQPLYEDYENFISYICKAYKGNPVPKACTELAHKETHEVRLRRIWHFLEGRTSMSALVEGVRSAFMAWINDV